MPMALCRPVMSRLAGIKATVASPGNPPGMGLGMLKRTMVSCFWLENGVSEWTFERSKYFHPRIFLAAAGSARIVVYFEEGLSWRRVAS